MKNFQNVIDRRYLNAKFAMASAKNELNKMREEDEGLDIIITIILVAVGLVLVGVVAKYGTSALKSASNANAGANSQLSTLQSTAGGDGATGLGGK